ncbi:hypothetical protein SAMN05216251_1361, partial [Actinacidiphila alni]
MWVTASNRTAITDAYAQAGEELCGADPGNPDRAASRFLAWLHAQRNRWLIVLDDLAEPADIRGLWPPDVPHGRTLVTTRRRDTALFSDGRHMVPVGVFTPDQAMSYLTATLPRHGNAATDAELGLLAEELGYLPLALSQAAAYLTDQGMGVGAYRRLLADRAGTLADSVPQSDSLPDDQGLTLAALWSLSVDRADQLRPVGLARRMLQLTAMLDPNGIPQRLLTGPPALAHLGGNRAGRGTPVTPAEALGALRALHRMSLIDHKSDGPLPAVHVHQLVQRATRDDLAVRDRDKAAVAAADALAAIWPDIEREVDLTKALRANAGTVIAHAGTALYAKGVHDLLFLLGRSLDEAGQLQAAIDHLSAMLDTATIHLGPDHPDTLIARNNLARMRGEAGDPAAAAEATADLLTDGLRVLGPDHP